MAGGNVVGKVTSAVNADTASYFITSSVTNASYAVSASHTLEADIADSISFVPQTVVSASWISASNFITLAQTSSYVLNAVSASYVSNLYPQQFLPSASWASASLQAQYSTQSLYSTQSITASYVLASNIDGNVIAYSASWASSSLSASFATTATSAVSATSATSAGSATTAVSASWASSSLSASFATTATSAVSATSATSAGSATTAVSASWASSSLSASYASQSYNGALAYVTFAGVTPVNVQESYNIGTITRVSTGQFRIPFSTYFPSKVWYAVTMQAHTASTEALSVTAPIPCGYAIISRTLTGFTASFTSASSAVNMDPRTASIMVFGY